MTSNLHLRQQLAEALRTSSQCQAQHAEAQEALFHARQLHVSLEQQLSSSQAAMHQLQQEHASLQQHLQQCTHVLSQSESRNEALEREVQELRRIAAGALDLVAAVVDVNNTAHKSSFISPSSPSLGPSPTSQPNKASASQPQHSTLPNGMTLQQQHVSDGNLLLGVPCPEPAPMRHSLLDHAGADQQYGLPSPAISYTTSGNLPALYDTGQTTGAPALLKQHGGCFDIATQQQQQQQQVEGTPQQQIQPQQHGTGQGNDPVGKSVLIHGQGKTQSTVQQHKEGEGIEQSISDVTDDQSNEDNDSTDSEVIVAVRLLEQLLSKPHSPATGSSTVHYKARYGCQSETNDLASCDLSGSVGVGSDLCSPIGKQVAEATDTKQRSSPCRLAFFDGGWASAGAGACPMEVSGAAQPSTLLLPAMQHTLASAPKIHVSATDSADNGQGSFGAWSLHPTLGSSRTPSNAGHTPPTTSSIRQVAAASSNPLHISAKAAGLSSETATLQLSLDVAVGTSLMPGPDNRQVQGWAHRQEQEQTQQGQGQHKQGYSQGQEQQQQGLWQRQEQAEETLGQGQAGGWQGVAQQGQGSSATQGTTTVGSGPQTSGALNVRSQLGTFPVGSINMPATGRQQRVPTPTPTSVEPPASVVLRRPTEPSSASNTRSGTPSVTSGAPAARNSQQQQQQYCVKADAQRGNQQPPPTQVYPPYSAPSASDRDMRERTSSTTASTRLGTQAKQPSCEASWPTQPGLQASRSVVPPLTGQGVSTGIGMAAQAGIIDQVNVPQITAAQPTPSTIKDGVQHTGDHRVLQPLSATSEPTGVMLTPPVSLQTRAGASDWPVRRLFDGTQATPAGAQVGAPLQPPGFTGRATHSNYQSSRAISSAIGVDQAHGAGTSDTVQGRGTVASTTRATALRMQGVGTVQSPGIVPSTAYVTALRDMCNELLQQVQQTPGGPVD